MEIMTFSLCSGNVLQNQGTQLASLTSQPPKPGPQRGLETERRTPRPPDNIHSIFFDGEKEAFNFCVFLNIYCMYFYIYVYILYNCSELCNLFNGAFHERNEHVETTYTRLTVDLE